MIQYQKHANSYMGGGYLHGGLGVKAPHFFEQVLEVPLAGVLHDQIEFVLKLYTVFSNSVL